MLGNIHDTDSSPFSNQVKQAGSPFKSSKNQARKNKRSNASNQPSREIPATTPPNTNPPITVKDVDSVSSMEVTNEVSNYYEGSSCDTTSISDISKMMMVSKIVTLSTKTYQI